MAKDWKRHMGRGPIFSARRSRLAQTRTVELAGDLEGDRGRYADRPHCRLRPIANGASRGSPRVTDRHAAASSRSPTSFPSSSGQVCATPYGLQRMCTTPRRIITIPTKRRFRTSSRSGNLCQVRSTPEASRKISSTTRSGHSSSMSRRQGAEPAAESGLQFFGHVAIEEERNS